MVASRLFLVLLLLSLPLATAALPTDPLWIPGVYDGADYDDCLAVFDSGSVGVTPPIRMDLTPLPPTGERIAFPDIGGPSPRIPLSTGPRSPPSV